MDRGCMRGGFPLNKKGRQALEDAPLATQFVVPQSTSFSVSAAEDSLLLVNNFRKSRTSCSKVADRKWIIGGLGGLPHWP